MPGHRLYIEHAIRRDRFALDHLRRNDRAASLVVDLDHLLQAGRIGVDDIVGQDHREGLIAHQFARHQHGMAETLGFLLARIGDMRQPRDGLDQRQGFFLAALLQRLLQLVADVEVVFHGGLAAAGDDDDFVAAGGNRLFHAVLNDGLVHQRHHLFGERLGGRQKASAQPGGGEDRLTNLFPGHECLVRNEVGPAGCPVLRLRLA